MKASFCIATLKHARSVIDQNDSTIIGVGDVIKLGVLDDIIQCSISINNLNVHSVGIHYLITSRNIIK